MKLIISERIRAKLARSDHAVTEEEIVQCFANRDRSTLIDDREVHRTDPQTQWFIAETYWNRTLKVVFIQNVHGIEIKTAYAPSHATLLLYLKKSKPRN